MRVTNAFQSKLQEKENEASEEQNVIEIKVREAN